VAEVLHRAHILFAAYITITLVSLFANAQGLVWGNVQAISILGAATVSHVALLDSLANAMVLPVIRNAFVGARVAKTLEAKFAIASVATRAGASHINSPNLLAPSPIVTTTVAHFARVGLKALNTITRPAALTCTCPFVGTSVGASRIFTAPAIIKKARVDIVANLASALVTLLARAHVLASADESAVCVRGAVAVIELAGIHRSTLLI
jgi:hypothetical protein